MRQLLGRKLTQYASSPLTLLCAKNWNSTKASRGKRTRRSSASKSPTEQTEELHTVKLTAESDNAQILDVKATSSPLSASEAAGPSTTSFWVKETLHYDADKVRQLANLFAGEWSEAFPTTVTNGADTQRHSVFLKSGKSLEEQLRHPKYQTKTDTVMRTKVKSSELSIHPCHSKILRDHSYRTNTVGTGQYNSMKNGDAIENWVTALLGSTNSSIVKLVKELLSVHSAVLQVQGAETAPSFSSFVSACEQQETLSALLKASRLQSHISNHSSVAPQFFLFFDKGGEDVVESVHLMFLAASSLEASVESFSRAGRAYSKERGSILSSSEVVEKRKIQRDKYEGKTKVHLSNGDAQQQDEWLRACSIRYEKLLFGLLTTLTTQLAAYNNQPSSSTTVQIRVDALMSALLSLLHVLDICMNNSESLRKSASCGGSRDANSGLEPVAAVDQCCLFEQLCAEASATIAQARLLTSLSDHPSAAFSENAGGLQSYVSYLAALRKQLTIIENRLSSIPHSASGQSCFQGVVSNFFLFCISVLRTTVATDVSASRAARLAVPGHKDADKKKPSLTQNDKALGLSNKTIVSLASHAEGLISVLHPRRNMTRAAQMAMQHRTTHSVLNMLLSTLWRYARVQAAQLPPSRMNRSSPLSQNDHHPLREKWYSPVNATSMTALVSAASSFWERHPGHVVLLLRSYYDLLAMVSNEWLPLALERCAESTLSEELDADSNDDGAASVVPFCSRIVRIGMTLQMDIVLLAAAHLGVEAEAPRAPSTPLDKVAAFRLRTRRANQAFMSRTIGSKQKTDQGPAQGEAGALNEAAVALEDEQRARWSQVLRLSGGLKVACCEALYRAVVSIAALCSRNAAAEVRLMISSHKTAPANAKKTPPAVALIQGVSRLFFCIPRTEYLFGLYTDEFVANDAAIEQSRRVYTACAGVFLWLRELSPSFGSHFANTAPEAPAATSAVAEDPSDAATATRDLAGLWSVCGTTKANALEAAFFLTYLLHHWPALSRSHFQQQQRHFENDHGSSPSHASPLMRVLQRDGLLSAQAPSPVDALIAPSTVEAYVAETLFHLQHDTASLLHHLRTTNRFYHFTGEMKDKTQLICDEALQRRHVSSTLSTVFAYQREPTFVWMPLESVQELLFELSEFPGLLTPTSSQSSAASLMSLRRDGAESERTRLNASHSTVREYSKVQVGSITCSFARAHGYLVRRLHVLSGILREYRSLLLKAPTAASEDMKGEESVSIASPQPPVEEQKMFKVVNSSSATLMSFSNMLLANSAHSPQEEGHRRNNYHWAHPWATMLREDFACLPAEMEGTPKWTRGVLRVMERMELVMQDAYRQGLFMNVVESQKQYKLQKRVRSQPMNQVDPTIAPLSAAEKTSAALQTSHEETRTVVELHVTRLSPNIPLGVVLSGEGFVLRIQETVCAPVEAVATGEAAVPNRTTARASSHELEEVTSPVAAALAACSGGPVEPATVVGGRVVAVDGVVVKGGRDVAVQVKGKTAFILFIERWG